MKVNKCMKNIKHNNINLHPEIKLIQYDACCRVMDILFQDFILSDGLIGAVIQRVGHLFNVFRLLITFL